MLFSAYLLSIEVSHASRNAFAANTENSEYYRAEKSMKIKITPSPTILVITLLLIGITKMLLGLLLS